MNANGRQAHHQQADAREGTRAASPDPRRAHRNAMYPACQGTKHERSGARHEKRVMHRDANVRIDTRWKTGEGAGETVGEKTGRGVALRVDADVMKVHLIHWHFRRGKQNARALCWFENLDVDKTEALELVGGAPSTRGPWDLGPAQRAWVCKAEIDPVGLLSRTDPNRPLFRGVKHDPLVSNVHNDAANSFVPLEIEALDRVAKVAVSKSNITHEATAY
mmetsp:Transcript_2627/g.4516  ORF Transcript_2627/g.4516 Transcript_2627/m.4516 type:complete len:220 (-) Transcript_2627:849-1508(-)